jgi:cytochrome c556
MRSIFALGTAAACALFATAAIAQQGPPPPTPEQKAQQSVELRQSVFKLLDWNNKPMGAMLRGQAPFDAGVVKTNATNIANLAEMIPALFTADTSSFTSVKTEALNNIWTNKADFDAKAKALIDAATALSAAAGSGGDAAALRPAVITMGKACGSCHDNFRQKEQE